MYWRSNHFVKNHYALVVEKRVIKDSPKWRPNVDSAYLHTLIQATYLNSSNDLNVFVWILRSNFGYLSTDGSGQKTLAHNKVYKKNSGKFYSCKGLHNFTLFLNKHSSVPLEHIQLRFTLTAQAYNTYSEESIAMHELTEKKMSCTWLYVKLDARGDSA